MRSPGFHPQHCKGGREEGGEERGREGRGERSKEEKETKWVVSASVQSSFGTVWSLGTSGQVGARPEEGVAAMSPSSAGACASMHVCARVRLCVLLQRLLCKHVNLFSFCVFFPSQDNWVSLKSWRGC